MSTVAIVGSGLIGRAWAIAFARAGWQVRLWDPDPAAAEAALATIDGLLADLAAQDMLDGAAAADVLAHMLAVPTLDEALAGADWVQENAPEDLDDQAGAVAGHRPPGRRRHAARQLHLGHRAVAVHRGAAGRAPLLHLPPDQPALPDPGGRAGPGALDRRPRPWPAPRRSSAASARRRSSCSASSTASS